jgi:hypothetical protein
VIPIFPRTHSNLGLDTAVRIDKLATYLLAATELGRIPRIRLPGLAVSLVAPSAVLRTTTQTLENSNPKKRISE